MTRFAACVALAFVAALAGCTREADAPRSAPALRPVVATAIADLAKRVPAREEPGPIDEDTERSMSGLFGFARSALRARPLAVADLVASPPAATLWLERTALDESLQHFDRELALEVLAARGTREDAAAVVAVLTRARAPEIRAIAAWRLGEFAHDEFLPDVVLRLRYETDWETVLWIGHALARHGIWTGLETMLIVAADAPDDSLRERAGAEAALLAAERGPESESDPARIVYLWNTGDPGSRLPPVQRSASYQLALWRWLARLDEFQLRGVDDCRFLMPRLDRFAAGVLAEALYDESPYVRLGVAQCLEAMGPRGRDAGWALLEHLDDPELGVWMAAALGRVGHPQARTALEERLGSEHGDAMRVAAARALGRIGLAESVPALRAAMAGARAGDGELRQALAEALVYCGSPDDAIAVLVAALTDARLEPSTSAAALRHHLVRQANAGIDGAAERLAAWDAAGRVAARASPNEDAPSPREVARERAALFASGR